ncbi:uncharacterized protein LOC131245541 [Magnolia sinica]|uniref:uncharacterized protein LOC131245541 n=1 Tax=Magnolia sinica TaxID=86752 RepID=UPI002659728F|nr:uncharacterized protein LOC131245541 [Magnolia sinica]
MLSSSSPTLPCHLPQTFCKKQRLFNSLPLKKPSTSSCLRIGVQEIAEIAQNKVLVAATVASAIGQLSKPFTSALYGNGVDFKAAVRSGGMPSTHSAGVVAAATSLGLERGFSDSIFGMSVVFAAIVMYDAQGVRREVGIHAKVLNTILLRNQENPTPCNMEEEVLAPLLPLSEKTGSYKPNSMAPSPPIHRLKDATSKPSMVSSSLVADGKEGLKKANDDYFPLKESVGHTEVQVLVGALLGFLVSLIVDVIL